MEPISVLCVIIATAALCALILQLFTIYENLDNILEFNDMHSKLEFSKSPGGINIDKTVFDPNDDILDVKQKWRCVQYKGMYVAGSIFGFYVNADKTIKTFSSLNDCTDFIFTHGDVTAIHNPCSDQNATSSEYCMLLNSIL